MKTCPDCGGKFVGFERFCHVCRRRERHKIPVPEEPLRPEEEITPEKAPRSKNAEYQARWREVHRAEALELQRERMRRLRAKDG